MNTKGIKRAREVGPATTDLKAEKARAPRGRSSSSRRPLPLPPCVSSRPPRAAGAAGKAATLQNPRGAKKWPASEMAPARCEAEPGTEEPRHHHAAAGSVTQLCLARHKGSARRLKAQRAERVSSGTTDTPPALESRAATMRSLRPPCGLYGCLCAGRDPERQLSARHNPQQQLALGIVTTAGRGTAEAAAALPLLESICWRCGTRAVPAGQRGQWPSEGPQQKQRREHTSVLHAALFLFYRQSLRIPQKP